MQHGDTILIQTTKINFTCFQSEFYVYYFDVLKRIRKGETRLSQIPIQNFSRSF